MGHNGSLREMGVPSISLGFSWFCCQGPRGLPGERGRPGAPGPAVSTPGPLGGGSLGSGRSPPGAARTGQCSVDVTEASSLSYRVLVEMMVLLVLLDPL